MFTLKLENYRGFLEESFDFSKINILIGENSAGKSSIFKFILALKQSLKSPNDTDYNLTLSSNLVDLGNYYETIYNHEQERNLCFSFELNKNYFDYFINFVVVAQEDTSEEINNKHIQEQNHIINVLGGEIKARNSIKFELSKDLDSHKNITTIISNEEIGQIKIVANSDGENAVHTIKDNPTCDIFFSSSFFKEIKIKAVEYKKNGFFTIIDSESLMKQIGEIPSVINKEKIFWSLAYLLISQNQLQLLLSKTEYINPLLFSVERFYITGDKKKINQIKNIEDLIYYVSFNSESDDFIEKLNKVLSSFGIADSFYVKKQGSSIKEPRIMLNGLDSNLSDVGYGVSLQIPIFAQAILSELRGGEILLIEQPEVHLHPNLQAKFIDTLLQIGNKNTYFIETHSEHIIRMLQVIVKNKKYDIEANDVSINYFRKEGFEMKKTFHEINPITGKLKPNFPKGFYDVSYNLAFQLMD